MEVVGWITVILLCALALAFVVIELGPVIHAEVSFWKFRKQKATEAKEDKARFKKEMGDLKYKAKKLDYMKKKGLITEEEVTLREAPVEEVIEDKNETIEEDPTYWVTMTGEKINPSDMENTEQIDEEAFEEPVNDETTEEKVYDNESLLDTPVIVEEKKEVKVNAKRKRK
jgi:hypothetical protein